MIFYKRKMTNLLMLLGVFFMSCCMTMAAAEEVLHSRSNKNMLHRGLLGSCGQKTTLLQSQFRNPSFPEADTKEMRCLYTVHIKKGVCAVRVDLDIFELAKFRSGGCLSDSLTVLGASGTPAPPFCGNLTNWSTTFQVDVPSKVVLVATLSGTPPHRFSIAVTQLLCDKIVPFVSPIVGSMRNNDTEEYEYYPPTDTPSTEAPTEAPDVDDDDDDDDDSDEDSDEEKDDVEATTINPDLPTPLPTIGLPTRKPQDVILVVSSEFQKFQPISNEHLNSESGLSESNFYMNNEKYSDHDNPDGYVSDPEGVIPEISLYKKFLEKNERERCLDTVVLKDETPRPTWYVVGGDYTNLNEYPWQVALVSGKKFFCGGSLINSRHILTAAHCIVGRTNITKLRVSLGDHDLSTRNETNHTVRHVSRIYWNLQYNPVTIMHDIAILEMDRPVEFSRTINPIRLPTERINEEYEKKKTCYNKDTKKSYSIGSVGSYKCEVFNCTEKGIEKTGNNKTECEVATEKPEHGCWEKALEVYPEGFLWITGCANYKCVDQEWQPISDNCSKSDDGPEVILTGWGRYDNKKSATSSVLKEYSAPLLDMEDCIAKWKNSSKIPVSKERHTCLDISKGAPCHGDSGGPLVQCSNSSCIQVGVVSFGHYECVDKGIPDVFTRVSHYMDWINMNLTPLSHLVYG